MKTLSKHPVKPESIAWRSLESYLRWRAKRKAATSGSKPCAGRCGRPISATRTHCRACGEERA